MPVPDLATLHLSHVTLRRLIRVGATPVLETTASYPVLEDPDGVLLPEAVERFHTGYRAVAEAFLTFSEGEPAREATDAFSAAGVGAVYTFDRRLLTCRLSASLALDEAGLTARLTVFRTVTYASRRGSLPARRAEAVDRWRLPELSLETVGKCRLFLEKS